VSEIGILGGGLAGLVLAGAAPRPAEVLEAEARVGGLCRTYERDGFSTDVGGHILFSRDEALLGRIIGALGTNVATRRRNNRIAFRGRRVKYPFENDLGALDREDTFDCLMSFLDNDAPAPPHPHFLAWMLYTLGRGITERYLLPYNRKIWKTEPSEMAIDWVERVPRPPVEDVLKSALGIETEGYTHQLHFQYPVTGGIEALIRGLELRASERATLRTGCTVRSVRKSDGGWVVNGEREYRTLVSTLPLVTLIDALEPVPPEVHCAARALRYNAIRVVMLGVDRRSGLDEMTALYVPDESVIFHRACFNCAFAPSMAPEGRASISCEITTREGDPAFVLSDAELGARVEADLRRCEVLSPADRVVAQLVRREPFAYVVPALDTARNLRLVRAYLDDIGIHVAGRFGRHEYLNMDATVQTAIDLAARL
jgi:protoporphyrinogen oxidase